MAQQTRSLTLFEMTMGNTLAQALGLAARVGLADHLYSRAMNRDELVSVLDFDPSALDRLLRLLELTGVVECGDGRYRLTEFGQPLRSDAVPSLNSWARFASSSGFGRSLCHLESALTTTVSGYEREFDHDVFTHLNLPGNDEERTSYDSAMGGVIGHEAAEISAAVELTAGQQLVDVGGGDGSLCAALAERHPAVGFTVFDAKDPSPADASHERVRRTKGDFFRSVPTGGDVYVLCRILHDWKDEDARLILDVCRRAMSDDARLVIIEQLVDRAERPFTALCDLNMAVLYGSAERTTNQYAELLESAGLALRSVAPLSSGRFVLNTTTSREETSND